MIRLKELRIKTQKTQTEIARELDLSKQSYGRYEKQMREADYSMLILFANYFHVSIDYLLGITEINFAINDVQNSLSEIETELIATCRKMDTRKKTALLTYAYGLEKE